MRALAPFRVWAQKAVACGRVMAPTTSLFIAPTCTCHWSSAGPAACIGSRSAPATLAQRCTGVGPEIRSVVVWDWSVMLARAPRPADEGSSLTEETVTQIRPSSTMPTSAPMPKACASGRLTPWCGEAWVAPAPPGRGPRPSSCCIGTPIVRCAGAPGVAARLYLASWTAGRTPPNWGNRPSPIMRS
jgi:hypothetical protein